MKIPISGCMVRALRQAHFGLRSCVTTVIMALLLATTNLMAMPVVKTLGGGALNEPYYGYVDNTNTLYARFYTPIGLAIDSTGSYLFVADRDNNVIRWLDIDLGKTFTFATNSINRPVGVAVDLSDNVFVLNRGTTNNISTNGTVLEFDWYGHLIATNATGLTNAAGIALDSAGNIYVTVNSNKLIRITPAGVQTNITTITNAGTSLIGIVVKHNGLIAACDAGNNGIWLINPTTTNSYSKLAGFNGASDNFIIGTYEFPYITGVSEASAKFNQPYGVAEAGDGSLIVTDSDNNRVKIVNAAGIVTNLYGVNFHYWWTGKTPTGGTAVLGWSDGTVVVPDQVGDVQARLPAGVCLSSDGTVYTTEDYYHIIRHVTGAGLQPQLPPPPAAPTGLTATATYGQVYLTWTASSGATNYNVKRSTTIGSETTIASTATTSYTDTTNVLNGTTYYYVVSALNAGGESANSSEVSATPPLPPVADPQIGYVDFPATNEPVSYTSVFHAGNSFSFNNDTPMVILGTNGALTYYTYSNTPTAGLVPNPTASSYSAPAGYQNGLYPSQVSLYTVAQIMPYVTIKAISEKNDGSPNSQVVLATFQFVTGNPVINGGNAALFTIIDVTAGAHLYYTLDGSDPSATNANAVDLGTVPSPTNVWTVSLGIQTNTLLKVIAFHNNYQNSAIVSNLFTTVGFQPNTISFGFSAGEASSDFIASPGQFFYAPVTLSVLPDTTMYSLQFNLTVTNAGPNPGPPITSGVFDFSSMLVKPIPNVTPIVYETIPPAMFVSTSPVPNPIMLDGSDNFSSLLFTDTNLNLLGVGWLERAGSTNLYDTLTQDLITYSMARDVLHLSKDGQIEVGGYAFSVPITATNGQTYQIQIGRPSATSDGIGAPGSSIYIATPTNGSLTAGAMNSIKIVTIGQLKYLVGNVYPFSWFNAGDFGNTNLQNADVMQVFESAIYGLDSPPLGSDFFDAMDSCGNIGVNNGSGIYTNTATYPYLFTYTTTNYIYTDDINTNTIGSTTDIITNTVSIYIDSTPITAHYTITTNAPTFTNVVLLTIIYPIPTYPNPYVPNLFDGNDQNINQIAFGDGVLDVCDVYVTFRRSLDPSLTWFRRFWTNGVRVAETVPNVVPNALLEPASILQPKVQGNISSTSSPQVNFVAGDYIPSAGQTISIPIIASVFGIYPLRVLMLNLTVVPLDGSPALITPVTFSANPALGTPWTTDQQGNGNYSTVWLNSGIAGLTGNATIGTLTVTIPANVTSMSAYAVHFDHASASPNGIASFPKQTLTGLITLSSRTNSYYNDGIPDSWRLRWFGTIYNLLSVSNACPSGDGVNNWKKYIAGVDPNTPDDFPSLNPRTPVPSGDTASIHWSSVAGKQYVIESSSSLFPGNWTTIATNTGTGIDMEFDDITGGNIRFYRVLILP